MICNGLDQEERCLEIYRQDIVEGDPTGLGQGNRRCHAGIVNENVQQRLARGDNRGFLELPPDTVRCFLPAIQVRFDGDGF